MRPRRQREYIPSRSDAEAKSAAAAAATDHWAAACAHSHAARAWSIVGDESRVAAHRAIARLHEAALRFLAGPRCLRCTADLSEGDLCERCRVQARLATVAGELGIGSRPAGRHGSVPTFGGSRWD